MISLLLLGHSLCCTAPRVDARREPAPVLESTANSNRTPAGRVRDGVLSVSLYAARGRWHPLDDKGPALEAEVFGEEGKAPSVPGPLVRASVGTRVDVRFRNTLADTVRLSWGCALRCGSADTIRVAPGATGVLRVTARIAGTFAYWGSPIQGGKPVETGEHGQLVGTIVVDAPGAPLDPVLALTEWVVPDSRKGERVVFLVNGRSWPHTERLTYTAGDSVRWRLVHLGGGLHPMHLHGFYFRVIDRSDGDTTHVVDASEKALAVTEEIGDLAAATIVWSPDRAGNWLLHCHKSFHTSYERNDDIADRPYPEAGHHGGADHAKEGMGGLVVGITVKPAPSVTLTAAAPAVASKQRLLVHERAHFWGAEAGMGFVLQRGDSVPARDSILVPGPVLTLTRGERSQVTVVNETKAHTAVHWHGIELESYFDGVAAWSGSGARIAPLIAPADSFVALMTPPRAGTFMYHTHVDDMRQLAAGMYGPLVVLEPGQKWNPATDHVFMIAQAGFDSPAWTVVNGVPAAYPMRLKANVAHRLRFLSLTVDHEATVTLEREDGAPVAWRPLAKDGADLAPGQAERPSKLVIGPGETFDFELLPAPGRYRLRFESLTNVLFTLVVR